jgi:hypothetical protein
LRFDRFVEADLEINQQIEFALQNVVQQLSASNAQLALSHRPAVAVVVSVLDAGQKYLVDRCTSGADVRSMSIRK